jgi:hypothetical protein
MADDNLAVSFQEAATADSEFDAIHDAFMETGRGRWFLTEYARRNRHADTALLLAAIGRIESILLAQRAASSLTQQTANPGAIKPEAELKGNSSGTSNSEAAQIAADSAARLRASIAPLRGVAWSLREQGDMRADVIEKQAVEFAEAASLFDVLRARLEAADAQLLAPEPALAPEPEPAPVAEPAAAEIPVVQAAPLAEPAIEETSPQVEAAAEETPPPLRTFAKMPMLETIPAPSASGVVNESVEPVADTSEEAGASDPQLLSQDEAEFTFQDLFDQTAAASEAARAAKAAAMTAKPALLVEEKPAAIAATEIADEIESDEAFNSAQEKRLSRLIDLFAGSREAGRLTAATPSRAAQTETLQSPARVTTPEPIATVFEPWPRVSVTASDVAAEAPSRGPVAKTFTPPTTARISPHDPLAPIVALSVEEKIALFS